MYILKHHHYVIIVSIMLVLLVAVGSGLHYAGFHTNSILTAKTSPHGVVAGTSIVQTSPPSPRVTITPAFSESPTAQCHMRAELPDATCTPGETDPRVTQDTIHQTICVPGYTSTVRPASSITHKLKVVSMQQYGFSGSTSLYEYDHLISLELGGAPQDTRNLWPEPGKSPNAKDSVEDTLHALVCSGTMTLQEAQQRISTDWTTALAGYQYYTFYFVCVLAL